MLLAAIALAPLAACGTDTHQNLNAVHAGFIAYLTGPNSVRDRGTLNLLAVGENSNQVIRDNISSNDFPSVTPAPGQLLVADYSLDPPRLLLVDASSPHVTEVGTGRGPRLSGNGLFAYCDARGRLVRSNVNDPHAVTIIYDLHAITSCPDIAWSNDGRLAFIAPRGSGPTSGNGLALYISYEDSVRPIDLPTNITGYAAISWSNDGRRVAVFADEVGIVYVDLENSGINVVDLPLRTQQSAFSPKSVTLLAAVSSRNGQTSLDVYENAQLVEELPLDTPTQFDAAFAWSPDGESIAVSTPHQLKAWKWRTGEESLALSKDPATDQRILPALAWLSSETHT